MGAMPINDATANAFAQAFLARLRGIPSKLGFDVRRSPAWVTHASIRAGQMHDTLLIVMDDANKSDSFHWMGRFKADVPILLDYPDFEPRAASLPLREERGAGLIVLQGSCKKDGQTILNLVLHNSALFNAGYVRYHAPMALMNLIIQIAPAAAGGETIPLATRFVPFALYVHVDDIKDIADLWNRCSMTLSKTLLEIASSGIGDFYEKKHMIAETFQVLKKSSVIVLGSYAEPECRELVSVRDALRSKGYEAHLIMDLPEIPEMSLDQKVRLWTLASRFNVMIDRFPSGHVAEYQVLKSQSAVLALIRPKGGGSTFMIGNDVADVNFIRSFEFQDSPLECLPMVVRWAESFVLSKTSSLGDYYPWRRT